MVKVQVKWNKQSFDNVELSQFSKGGDFKAHFSQLTGVPLDRLKVMGLGAGLLKDDVDISSLKVKENAQVKLLGTAEVLVEPQEKTVFAEDIAGDENADAIMNSYSAGLVNMGNTCYANASLQSLRIIPELRDELNKYQGASSSQNDLSESITASLRDLLKDMDKSNSDGVRPFQFLNAFRRAYPQFDEKTSTPMGDVHAQQDADEFLTSLLNTLAQRLGGSSSSSENTIGKLFRGKLETTLQCTEAEEPVTTSTEDFQKLSCHISQQTNNLFAGVEQSLVGTVEKNSPTLNRDALYQKTQKISKLPPYLIVNFVRFFWKAKEQVKAKVLRDVKFPTVFDVYDFCTEDYKKELSEKREELRRIKEEKIMSKQSDEPREKKQKMDDVETENAEKKSLTDTPDTAWYELCGVVTHKGRTANSGHYVGWVKSDNGRWLKFDDDEVSEVTEEDVKKLSGGGDWHIASTLLYRKLNEAP